MVENYLRATRFYHVSRIGVIRGFHPLSAALVERWRPETHTFVLPVGEATVTLEDVAHIFGLPIDREPVSGWIDSSSDFLQSQSIVIFGREAEVSHSSKSYIKLGWVRRIRDVEPLDTEESIRRYVRCHIFCLLGSTLFADKSTAYPARSIYRCFAISSRSIHIVGGQHVSHIFTEHYAVHHDMIQRRWIALLICCLFGHGSECRVLRVYRDIPFHRLRYQLP
ncbi:hypothetical protein Ahy_B09g096080 isoform E [Arachis hypogaea]|nr:hypothetical protein Ahy_B09g096080 isoform E [Arachis hypogaea]